MFQTWGRLRSFANAQRKGGFHRIGEPGNAPGARHGVPPRNFTPSQANRTNTMAPAMIRAWRSVVRGARGWAASSSSSRLCSSWPMSSWAGTLTRAGSSSLAET